MIFTPFAFMATPSGGGGFDTDAQAFINEVEGTGVTLSTTIKDALNDFYTGLKADSLYSKMAWMYPFVGGTAAANAISGINPTNANYDLSWSGNVTHTSAGVDTRGSIGYGTPNISPSNVHTSINSVTLGGYVSVATTNDQGFLVSDGVNNATRYQLNVPFNSNVVGSSIGINTPAQYDNTVAPVGRWIASRTSQTLNTIYKNGLSVATSTADNSTGTLNTANFTLFNWNGFDFDGVCGFVFGAQGFNSTEAANFDSRLATFMTALGR